VLFRSRVFFFSFSKIDFVVFVSVLVLGVV